MMNIPVDLLTAIVGGGLVGVLLGRIYFAQLHRSAARLVHGGLDWSFAGWVVIRIVGALATFVLLMRWSPAAAIAGLLGFSLARGWVVSSKGLR
jgi:hypothetical protein